MRGFFIALTRNIVSFLGAAITTATAVVFLTLFLMEGLGFEGGPYFGILTFLILPGIFAFGLALIPIGIWWDRRRGRGAGASALPVIDLNSPRTRGIALTFILLTLGNTIIIALATYKGVEVMDSTEFCGQTCHSVMAPEFTTYQNSPHAQVPCVSCHIGPGAGWFVKSKLSGSWQLVSVTMKLYPKPIPTPVRNLRPARETCEQCHWPTKFIGDRLRIITRYDGNETNTEKKTVLLLHIGGQQGLSSQGIHWHVDRGIQIRYLADSTRETIRMVELRRADGTIKTFRMPEEPAGTDGTTGAKAAAGKTGGEGEGDATPDWRTMDCVDCHNRPTHIYRAPEDELDHSIQTGKVARSLPFVRREGLRLLQESYPTPDAARDGLRQKLLGFYNASYPAVVSSQREQIESAALELGAIWTRNVFPSMNITWGTYPNHLGHQNNPGCFRCHDDLHKTEAGETISQDCGTCHSLLAMDEENPEILSQLKP
jgi:nitrate/TMAO reductase-like tetraheme cytochrome c subunit